VSDINTLLPEKLRSTAFFSEISSLMDSVIDSQLAESSSNFEGIDSRVSYIIDEIINKHKDTDALSSAELFNVLNEQGYGYILDVLDLSASEKLGHYKSMLSFISVIHALKGHRRGVELIMDLITQGSLSEYSIMEWWEDTESDPLPENGTAVVTLDFTDHSLVGFNTLDRLKAFFAAYVYAQVAISVSSGGLASSRVFIHTETRQTHESTTANAVL